MSALGHKQTFAVQEPMSALPPKADMCGATMDVRFGPKADSCTAANNCLFDDLVGACLATLQAHPFGRVPVLVPCRDLHDMDRIASMGSSFDHRGRSKTDDGARKIPDTSCCGTESSGPRVRCRQARAPART